MPATAASIREALSDPAAFATTMVSAVIADWGVECLRWSPAAIQMELYADFAIDLSPNRFDVLMGGIVVLTTDRCFKLVPDFCTLCNSLAGHGYDPATWDPPSCVDIAWGITEACFLEHLILGKDEDDREPFSPEVRHFIGATCREEGLVNPPDILRISLSDKADRDARIIASWSAEPEMFSAIHEAAGARSAAITTEVKGRLRLLCGQLERLCGQQLPFAAALGSAARA